MVVYSVAALVSFANASQLELIDGLKSNSICEMLPLPLPVQCMVALGKIVPSLSIVVVSTTLNPIIGSTENGSGSVVFGDKSRSTSCSLVAHVYMSALVSFSVKSTLKSGLIPNSTTSNVLSLQPKRVLLILTVSPASNCKPDGLHG